MSMQIILGGQMFLQGVVTERPAPFASKTSGVVYHQFTVEGVVVGVPPHLVDYMPRLGKEVKIELSGRMFRGVARFDLVGIPEIILEAIPAGVDVRASVPVVVDPGGRNAAVPKK